MNRFIRVTMSAVMVVIVLLATPVTAQTWNIGASTNPGGAGSVIATLSLSGETLTISGVGAMRIFYILTSDGTLHTDIPWVNFRHSITNIVIEEGVTSIGNNAFRGCTGLTSVTIPNSVTTIGESAFSGCTGLTSVTIPNSVMTIGGGAFFGCTGLTSVTIPNSVTTIGNNAFSGCTGLTSVTIPNSVTTIGESAFSGCTGLTSVTIPNSVTTIGNNAFRGCTGLTSVTIPNSVTTIGNNAFFGCTGLTSVTIPNSVTTIGINAFRSCIGLMSINVMPDNVNFSSEDGVLFNKNKTILIMYPQGRQGAYSISNSVTTIGESAFSGCTGLTSVTIPNSVTTIEAGAFGGCTGLTSVTIPNSVTTIEAGAFGGCTGLMSVIILNPTPPNITLNPFNSTPTNKCLYVPHARTNVYGSNSNWRSSFNCISNLTHLSSLSVSSGTLSPEFNPSVTDYSLTVPNDVNSLTVTAIPIYTESDVTGTGEKTLNIGSNTFDIMVIEAGLSSVNRTYTLTVIRQVAVTFDSQGGSTISSQSITPNDAAAKPADPTRTNYVFGGWYKEAECTTNAWNFDTDVVNTNTTLYAKWTLNTYTITWNADGGTPPPTQTIVSHGSSIAAPSTMTKTGYTFGGWYSDAAMIDEVTFPINATTDVTLYAKWIFTPVTNIAVLFPSTIEVGQQLKLSGTVEPHNAKNQTITWSVFTATPTGAVIIDNGTLFTLTEGTAFIRATVVNGANNGTANYMQNFFITIGTNTSIASNDRIIPPLNSESQPTAFVNQLTSEFTVGSNPVNRQSGEVNFFWQGKRIQDARLTIFDASGNAINNIKITDNALNTQHRRPVGSWDLTDRRGRVVSEGTYLVRGVVVTSDGKRERVSVLVGVQ